MKMHIDELKGRIDDQTLMKAIDLWSANLPDEILKMWRAAPVGNHRPDLARFAADQAYHTLLAAIAESKTAA
jgi:hypothetical protein